MMQKSDPNSLDRFLSPRAIAVIGASPEPHRIRGALLRLLRKNNYPGAIYPINPTYKEINGLACYPSVAAIGKPIDLALVAIPAAAVLGALEECAAAGVANAVIISSGFAEDGVAPSDQQDRIVALAKRTGMRICGPNAEGFHNEVDRVTATFSPATDRDMAVPDAPALPQRIGIVAQSGGMGFALYNRGRAMGLAFSVITTTGNEADLTAADFLAHLAARDDTSAILLFLEAIRDPVQFAAAAAVARAKNKPVVAIKIGRSAVSKAAVSSHTASMAGWDVAYDAMFHRHGIVVARDLEEALALMAALVTNPPARGPRVAIVTVSGGAGALAADMIAAAGLTMPELSAETQAAIRSFIPSYGATRNPIDLTAGGAQGGGLLRTIELLSRDDAIDQIAVAVSLANPTRVSFDHAGLQALLKERRKPILFHSYTLPSPLGQNGMIEAGAAVFTSMDMLAAAARMLTRSEPPRPVPKPLVLPDAVQARLAGAPGPLAEHAAKALIAAAGIKIPNGALARDEADLDAIAATLSFPLAAKIQSVDIPHKTEVEGVRLNIQDLPSLREARRALMAAAKRHRPQARIDGVLVEAMAGRGVEMIIGIIRDPTFGPVVMVGAGGITTELYRDTSYRLAPVDEDEAKAMLRELRSVALLEGFRGAPKADVAALAQLISQVSRIADAGRDHIAELECNPVIVHPAGQGCSVADVLMVLAPKDEEAAA